MKLLTNVLEVYAHGAHEPLRMQSPVSGSRGYFCVVCCASDAGFAEVLLAGWIIHAVERTDIDDLGDPHMERSCDACGKRLFLDKSL